jgi:hypothetical protein
MLHAVIQTDSDAFHFFGEVNGYNMQTLHQHVCQTMREVGSVRLLLRIDPADQEVFKALGPKWLSNVAGTIVEVSVRAN